MKNNVLKLIDNAKRNLWIMESKEVNLDIKTKDPFLIEELKYLKKQKEFIEKISRDEKFLGKTLLKYEQNKSSNYKLCLLKVDATEFELRSIIIANNYKWRADKDFINVDLSEFNNRFNNNVEGYVVFHALGIIYGKVIACDVEKVINTIVLDLVNSTIEDVYIFE